MDTLKPLKLSHTMMSIVMVLSIKKPWGSWKLSKRKGHYLKLGSDTMEVTIIIVIIGLDRL